MTVDGRCARYTPPLLDEANIIKVQESLFCKTTESLSRSRLCNRYGITNRSATHYLQKQGKLMQQQWVLRVTGPIKDGFWVRATVAIAHAQWAWRNSLLGLDISYWSPEDPYLNPENSHLDGWTSYFEPVQQDTQNAVLIQLSCAAAARAWEQYGNYASSYADALIQRQIRVEAIRRLPLRPRRYFVDAANGFWKAHIHDASRVLGVHLRGTDKYVMQRIDVARYLPLTRAFLCHTPNATIFVATDDKRMLREYRARVANTHPGTTVVARDVLRGDSRLNPALSACDKADAAPKANATAFKTCVERIGRPELRTLGADVLVDTLLLAKSDFLLKSASAVSDFAVYFNPTLSRESFDFQLEGQPEPEWAGCRSTPKRLLKRIIKK